LATDAKTGSVLNGTVEVVQLKGGQISEVTVGRGPSGMALSADGSTLAVANGHSDSVSLLDTKTLEARTVSIPTWPDKLLGSTPVALAFSPDGARLYVATAAMNAITVLKKTPDSFAFAGAIPAGWFPDALQVDSHGNLLIVNVKGRGNTEDGKGGHQTHSFEGSLERVPAPSEPILKSGLREVQSMSTLNYKNAKNANALSSLGIQHVFLLVKENRTYDQVFGDMPQGNSDPKFLMYGREVIPNHHALAEQFVLLDNFYASGAISFDGHQWLESDATERVLRSSPRGYE
jgi:hypothetical protein